LRGRSLKWYMKAIKTGVQWQAFTLGQFHLKFIVEFKFPQLEKQALSELRDIKQREG
jgi:TPR repeat protein